MAAGACFQPTKPVNIGRKANAQPSEAVLVNDLVGYSSAKEFLNEKSNF